MLKSSGEMKTSQEQEQSMIVIVLLQRTVEYYIEWLHFTLYNVPVPCAVPGLVSGIGARTPAPSEAGAP